MPSFPDLEAITDRWELVVGYDPDAGSLKAVGMDSTSRTLRIQNWVWNSSTMVWDKMKQPNFQNTGDVYLEVDDLEEYIQDQQLQYQLDDYDVSGNPIYVGYQDKYGNYMIKRVNTTTGAVDYTKGSTAYSTAWTNRASESYSDYATTWA